MTGNGALAEEERGGNLPVRPPLGDEYGDALLRRRQPFPACATADPPKLTARLLGPGGSTKVLEPAQRLADCLARGSLLPRSPAEDAERKKGTGPPVGISNVVALPDGLFDEGVGATRITLSGGDESTRSGYVAKHPLSPDAASICLPDVEHFHGLVDKGWLRPSVLVLSSIAGTIAIIRGLA